MTARLFIREVGARDFTQHNGEFEDDEDAEAEGSRLCREGNVEAFQVWSLVTHKERHWAMKEVTQ